MSETVGAVLLVEDSEDDVFAFRRAYKKANLDLPLQIVTDGQQAVDYLAGDGEFAARDRYPLPRLMFLDLKLPYLDGFEVFSWMRDRKDLSSVSVVVLTGSDEQRDRQQATELGARGYIVKPAEPNELVDVFENLGLLPEAS
ncbi:MAG TPA: response regulator [Fimbriimonas sp.]|nr:response regulator [Fimbriimonas sp.]